MTLPPVNVLQLNLKNVKKSEFIGSLAHISFFDFCVLYILTLYYSYQRPISHNRKNFYLEKKNRRIQGTIAEVVVVTTGHNEGEYKG